MLKKKETIKKGKYLEKINYEIIYRIGDDIFIISFYAKENSFIYDIELKKGDKYLGNIVPEDINQNIIQLYNKFEIFVEALGNKKSQNYKLYEEMIDSYKQKKKFNLLITLFLRVYGNIDIEKSKQPYSKLLSIFRKISEKTDIGNNDRDKNLNLYLDNFKQIYLNAGNVINYYGQFIEIYEFNRKKVNEEFYDLVMEVATEKDNSYKYSKQLKYLLDLPNNIEENKRNIEKSKNKNINQEPLLSKSTIIKLNQEQKPEEKKIKQIQKILIIKEKIKINKIKYIIML